jgi:hypothetical protein
MSSIGSASKSTISAHGDAPVNWFLTNGIITRCSLILGWHAKAKTPRKQKIK